MERLFVLCCVFGLSLSLPSNVFEFEQPQNGGNHWALLVAGSNGYFNYRHQADVCHAYQILHAHGIPDERIVVMMYDDIAENSENPVKGNLINHPDGPNVYEGIIKDYTGKEVNPETFLSVLKGEKDKVNGKVIDSGPNDHVFVNFVDHGAPGILGFGSKTLKAKKLMDAIMFMHDNKKYDKADKVKSEDVPLESLRRSLNLVSSKEEAVNIQQQIEQILKEREVVNKTMKQIIAMATDDHVLTTNVMETRHKISAWDCYEENDYALRKLYMFVNMCEMHVPREAINAAIEEVCNVGKVNIQ
ncbi:LGMN-like protein [Mya arenaria]|uniref:LGMN-like protein n=1 Tax=Mya arenaria TaxID=6604 RepID=A0ABY7FBA8_MYAAR|nr:LGMN-like protein [Mya arenaria]